MTISVEQKLHDAYQRNAGCRLSAGDVAALLKDDALSVRITNVACKEVGIPERGKDVISLVLFETWKQFKERLKRDRN